MTPEETKVLVDGLTLVLAIIVAVAGFWKFTVEKRKDREARAREKFGEYLQDARANISFMLEFWPPKDGTSPADKAAYRLFIARVMWACEEAVIAFDSADWKECINEQLEYHTAYFTTPEFRRHMKTLDEKLQGHLVDNGFVPAEWRAAGRS